MGKNVKIVLDRAMKSKRGDKDPRSLLGLINFWYVQEHRKLIT